MLMSAADQRSYPRLAYYVRVNLPDVINVPIIVNALNNIGQINMARLRLALRWGNIPSVRVADLDPGIYGEFSPGANSTELRISRQVVRDFEAGRGIRTTARGGRVYIVGVTILHELVHWGDDQDGVDRPGEEGEEFETAVYGGVVP
jgi:hypothetical protein